MWFGAPVEVVDVHSTFVAFQIHDSRRLERVRAHCMSHTPRSMNWYIANLHDGSYMCFVPSAVDDQIYAIEQTCSFDQARSFGSKQSADSLLDKIGRAFSWADYDVIDERAALVLYVVCS